MIAIISDIHGNYSALKEVLRRIDDLKITEIYCLGDVVGYYSQVNECCNELRNRSVNCVMGNHDWYLVSGTKCERSRSVNDCLDYQRRIIAKENLEWIQSFQIYRQVYGVSMVHGGWRNPIDEYLEPSELYFQDIIGSFFTSGHNHVSGVFHFKTGVYCNPGSVGQPRDGDFRASFATFDGEDFQIHRVKYNINKVGELMNEAGFNSYYYGCLQDASEHLHK